MPPVQLFGRHWRVGSDDFICPAVTELLVRLGWLVVFVGVVVFHLRETETLQCLGEEYNETTAYLLTTLGLLVVSCCSVVLLAVHSGRGKMFHRPSSDTPDPRRWVSTLLYLNMGLNLTELVWTICGTAFTINDFVQCKDRMHARTVIIVVLVIIGLTYILLILKFLFFVASFKPFARVRRGEESVLLQPERHSRETELNYRSLRCCAPCVTDENTVQAFRDIAGLLSKILHDTELVPTDIVAGLVLLNHQHSRDKRASSLERDMGVEDVVAQVRGEVMLLDWQKITHYYQFASAAYGYWWYVIQAPCTHFCSLGAYLNCCPSLCCCRKRLAREFPVFGDGFCQCNLAAIRAMLDVPFQDIIVFDNRNSLEEVPFFLVADRNSKSLVVGIRGTLSLHDMLTDLRGEPCKMSDSSPHGIGVDCSWNGHQGMVNAANYVYKRLHGLPTKENSGQSKTPDLLGLALYDPEYFGYDLVVTGHSLGAGTAVILAFLLRAKYPEVKVTCYAYSPPGGLLSRSAAEESEKFTVSLVVGDDVIPRTSLANIADLSTRVKNVCRDCSLPKYKILGYGLLACCCCAKPQDLAEEVDRLFPSQGNSPRSDTSSTNGLLMSGARKQCSRQQSTESIAALRSIEEMYLPGRLVHCTQADDGIHIVSEVDRSSFSEILVSPSMLLDHLPNNVETVLKALGDSPMIRPLNKQPVC